jgi:hypothetical protein
VELGQGEVNRRFLGDVLENRWACGGGGLGLLAAMLVCAAMLALAGPSSDAAASDDELRFVPGTLAKLGTPDADDGGDGSSTPVVAPQTPPPLPVVEPSHVTTDPTPHPRPTHEHGKPSPHPSGGGKLPGPPSPSGDPWGTPDGWDDLVRAGDPWATDVMRRLEEMTVRPFDGDPGPGVVRFQLTVCKDGEHTKIARKGGDAKPATHDAVAIAVEQLDLPPIPARLAASMRGSCAKIRYTFAWSDERVE